MRIEEVMTNAVDVVAPDDALRDLASRMVDRQISCLVVCDKDRPVGIISERDIVRVLAVALNAPDHLEVAADVMTSTPISIRANWSVDRAIKLAHEHGIRHLVVTDDQERLAGLVTQTDLLNAQQGELEQKVRERTDELQKANDRLRKISLRDPLLGIGNRRAMDREMERLHLIAKRYGRPYSVILLDVDHFKAYNDFYGHPQADQVLRQIATRLGEIARASDSLFRYGGEEMLILMPETGLEGALVAAERARRGIEELQIRQESSPLGVVTVSAGVAVFHEKGATPPDNWRDLLTRSDASLYDAKRNGRNRVGAVTPAKTK